MKKILKSYLNRLTNLTTNNRSILLLRPTGDQFLDLNELDFENGELSFSVVEALINRKSSIKLCEELDSRDGKANELSNKLKKIYRHDKFITDERGAKDLYVAWPFIKGKLLDQTNIRAPLLFFPVELELQNSQWMLSLRKDENIMLNKSFLLAYAHFNKISLSEELIEKTLDDWDKDPQIFRTALYSLLKESPLRINFNQELFVDKLLPFHSYKKDEFEEKYETGELKLFSEAVLGIFPQAGSYLVPDYNFLIEQDGLQDLEEFFYQKTDHEHHNEQNRPDTSHYLNRVKEEHTFTPFKMDASQENSIKAVKKGNSLVVQGPPGSGKSQLISNLISDYIARGKRVLMVCQKRAALDVVYQRLKEEGVSDFVGLVHDFKNDRKSIYSQINAQIERLQENKIKNNSLDAIYLERMFLQASRKIDQIAEELEEFKKALFDTSECGVSIKELYLTSDKHKTQTSLKREFKFFTFDVLENFLQILRNYFIYSEKFEKADYEWKERVSFADFTIADFNIIKELFEEIPKFQQEVSKQTTTHFGKPLSIHECERIWAKQSIFKSFLELAHHEDVFQIFKLILDVPKKDLTWLTNIELSILQCYENEGPEESLEKHQLGEFQKTLVNAQNAKGSLFTWINWALFSKEKFWIKRVLVANNLTNDKKGIEILTTRLDNRMNLEHNLSELRDQEWIINVPEQNFKAQFQGWIHWHKEAFGLKDIYYKIKDFFGLEIKAISLIKLEKSIQKILKLSEKAVIEKKRWLQHLNSGKIDALLSNPNHAQNLLKVLEDDFDALCEYDLIYSQFKSHEVDVVKRLLEDYAHLSSEDLVSIFVNSLKLSWIDHIESKYPMLRSVSTLKFRQLEKELQHNVKEKLKLSKDILLLKVRERTYKEVEVNRLNNLVTYRDLGHQVTKKRMIWPIRKLVANFSNELFNLVPCWMASPEAVSAIFPMESFFDLVIFDEASQCFAENGIPAIYRGKQIVITGDDKQLSPSDIYRPKWEDEDDETPETQIDSLLHLGSRYLMQTQLTGHYRSKTLELIDFSNHHFYNGNLTLLPDYEDINSCEPSIQYIKVEGVWEKNSNEAEALKVTEEVIALLKKGIKDIGIVTFNFSQQLLILNTLEAEAASNKMSIPSSLFIKNIENVQGDERDVIIFSTGYAPDKKGKMMMNFGSLNAQGGENRLNVAVTRARQKILIISSIYPPQLKVEDSKHEGPKLFKKYLQYALDVSEGNYQSLWQPSGSLPADWLLKQKLPSLLIQSTSESLVSNALPFSDLTLKDKETYKCIILTDDELYYHGISAKDSHVYNKLTLKNKGWKIKDFYSREYWNNKEGLKEEYAKFRNKLDEKESTLL